MGRRLSRGEEADNIRQLGNFRAFWMDSPEYPLENQANDHIHYPVDVTYDYAGGRSKIEFSTTFRAFVGSGPNDGDVNLDDTSKVRIDEFHLSFKAAFQNYEYDEQDHSLTVSDNSDKMGGRYSVRIKPSIEKP